MKSALLAIAAVCVLAAGACLSESSPALVVESSDRPGEGIDTVNLRATDFAFSADRASVPGGDVQFRVENAGTERHEFVLVPVDGEHYGMPVAQSAPLDPGETRYIRVNVSAGTYRVVCLRVSVVEGVPLSHMPLGMSADLEVAK